MGGISNHRTSGVEQHSATVLVHICLLIGKSFVDWEKIQDCDFLGILGVGFLFLKLSASEYYSP